MVAQQSLHFQMVKSVLSHFEMSLSCTTIIQIIYMDSRHFIVIVHCTSRT